MSATYIPAINGQPDASRAPERVLRRTAREEETPMNAARHKVLVVDDEASVRQALYRDLRHDGYELLLVGSGEEARDILQSEQIAVVVTDENMPGIDGIELLEWAKTVVPATVRIMFTQYYNDSEVNLPAVNRAEVFRFLCKPWEADELRKVVREAVDRFVCGANVRQSEARFTKCKEAEEKLRAANQQLQAGNQQLRITDRQRCASDQQLGMANQQLQETEERLQESERRLRLALSAADMGTWRRVPSANRDVRDGSFNAILGLEPVETTQPMEDFASRVHPEDRPAVEKAIESVARERKGYTAEFRIVRPDGEVRWLYDRGTGIYDDKGEMTYMTGAVVDITERKRAERELKRTVEDLARSNRDLEQFAYVASHDLQEPLRMVSSYSQLLARRYKDVLDKDANEFIDYAVDGAVRMQRLIEDLLSYSRISSRGKEPKTGETHSALGEAIANLSTAISESGAVVTNNDLPEVRTDRVQLIQVFQNLISNAIKFHGEEAPRVHVSAERKGREWRFAVKDNGMGIDAEYRERIFTIFQRLHGKDAYPGTGMGLALCKRIVERHGGRIWVESEPGKGSTFYFALPA